LYSIEVTQHIFSLCLATP